MGLHPPTQACLSRKSSLSILTGNAPQDMTPTYFNPGSVS
ncbi:hypothetical protein AM1_3723 [Acaryochloris marina MBIC11017]|uniref:Uncharacterized protein n=1 Tax=Acaryochloris marina (strain MBIC 11017) TaxID=329726 RepID=B0C4G9_ACAM1|nr:hypothetical protein AM1_3723 [Acaryochloris marina MBIC11017]